MITKEDALKGGGCFNPNYANVTASIFNKTPFFDKRDIVQVKYEMIRAASNDEGTITKISNDYGFSRNSYYQISKTFHNGGLCALVPKKVGPKKPHKLSAEVAAFIDSFLEGSPNTKVKEISVAIKTSMGIDIHTRTIYRYLKKN